VYMSTVWSCTQVASHAKARAYSGIVTGQKAWPSSDAKIEQQNMRKKDLQ